MKDQETNKSTLVTRTNSINCQKREDEAKLNDKDLRKELNKEFQRVY